LNAYARADQTITVTTAAPSTAGYNTSFSVAAGSSSGLTVAIATTGSGTGSGSGTATVLMTSGIGTATVTFTQAGNANYNPATAVVETTMAQKVDQTIVWNTPAAIPYGAPLSATQLDATVTPAGPAPAGALTYTPGLGTVLAPGMQTLMVTVAATDNYNAATATVTLSVLSAAQQADNLIALVDALVDAGDLNHGNGNALTSKLALKGNNGDTGKVNAFINQINAFVNTGRLTPAQAALLLNGADDLLLSLSLG
jgi:hypothetical protein